MLSHMLGAPTPAVARRFRTLTLLAAMESPYLLRLVRSLKRRTIPETEKRPEAHGGGRWDNLDIGEEGRYTVVAGYLQHLGRDGKASVLDVGCGPRILQSYLAVHGYERYVGVDFAAENVATARVRTDERTGFEVADASLYQPRGTL